MKLCSPFFLCTYFLLYFYYFLDSQVNAHHVIFENIGQMAGAISYQHVRFTLNLSSIVNQQNLVHTALKDLLSNLTRNPPPTSSSGSSKWLTRSYNNAVQIVRFHLLESEQFREDLSSLYLSLPVIQSAEIDSERKRKRRSIGKILKFTKKACLLYTSDAADE